MNIIKPQKLNIGDTVGLISPSSSMAAKVPHRLNIGIKCLKKIGFKVKTGKNALKDSGNKAGNGRERAQDIMEFFEDNEIKAIISNIGGYNANDVIPYLDYELIENNPKIFIGYSDITVLHWALYKKSYLVTFYGPAVLTQFANNPGLMKFTEDYFKKATMEVEPIGEISPSAEWTDEVLNWFEKKDLERPRKMKKNKGWQWIRQGNAKGELLGGCLTSMLHLRGTDYWPDFKSKIFFWETPESSCDFTCGLPLNSVEAYLIDLKLSGVFKKIAGMIIGRPFAYSEAEVNALINIILDITKNYNFPILFGVDIGHTDPMITLPIGVKATLDSKKNIFKITEPGVL